MEPYTEQELFNLRQVVVEPDTVLDRFKCVLTCTVDGKESIVGKRKWKVAEVKGEGYIGDDAAIRTLVSRLKNKLGRLGSRLISRRSYGYMFTN